LALLMAGAGSSEPAVAVGSYYASAAAWAWNATWLFGGDKLIWTILLVLAGGVIGVIIPLIGQMYKKSMGRSTTASEVTAKTIIRDVLNIPSAIRGVVGVAIVLLGVFVFNLVRYPVIHEAKLQSRSHILSPDSTFDIFNGLCAADLLQVPGGWCVIFTGPEESGKIKSELRRILHEALGGVNFPGLPNRNLGAPRFPEPSAQPGITIHGSNALAHALGGPRVGLGGFFRYSLLTRQSMASRRFAAPKMRCG
jgi:hypothetical protein